jgi:hypothetical protein
MKKLYTCLIIFNLFGHLFPVLAQQTNVRVSVTKVYGDYWFEELTQNEYRWRLQLNNFPQYTACISKDNVFRGWFPADVTLATNLPVENVANPLSIRMEAWEEDAAPDCIHNANDDAYCNQSNEIYFQGYEPGTTHVVQKTNCNGRWGAEYSFSYDVPKPLEPLILSPPAGNICDVNPTLNLMVQSFVSSVFASELKFIVEYHTVYTGWKFLKEVPGTTPSFTVTGLRELDGIKNINTNTVVQFRVRSKFRNMYYSKYSWPSSKITVSPLAPTINSIALECASDGESKIIVNISKPFIYPNDSLSYSLRLGYFPGSCTPATGCIESVAAKIKFANTFEIDNISNGMYTLRISNPGGVYGVCHNYAFPIVLECSNAENSIKGTIQVTNSVNPGSGELDVSVELTKKQRLSLFIYDMQGILYHKENWTSTQGVNSKIKVLKSGVYIIKTVTDTESKLIRIYLSN